MIDPLGYLDILLQALEVFTLIGFLVLFFLERSSYGRDSIGRESWPTVLFYNILTAGAYGVYWRLKVTYALYSRDRFSSWQWVFVLVAVFVIYMTAPKVMLMLTIWDFVIGNRLISLTGKKYSWIRTLIFGHLYLADVVEDRADFLPLDFRVARPERRQRIVKAYGVVLVIVLSGIGLFYRGLVMHREREFEKIPTEAVDRSGHWQEIDEKYEKIYFVDETGLRDTFAWMRNPNFANVGEWSRYKVSTKFHDGYVYSYSWFSCIEKHKLVEMNSSLLVLRNAASKTLIESRIEPETFAEKRQDFMKSGETSEGWEWGELLRSPWVCEFAFISETWDQSLNYIIDTDLDLLPSYKITLERP